MAFYERVPLTRSPEFERIQSLGWREWDDYTMRNCADYYTAKLKTHTGTMRLRPIQAAALHEVLTYGGVFGAIAVGGGKTLLSLLSASVAQAIRPLLLLPANLIEKTRREWRVLANHWRITPSIQIQSYETLGREGAAKFLEGQDFDFIFADEAHRLKNVKAGVTRRVARYMHLRPSTRFNAVSGTLIPKDEIKEFAHIIVWCLKSGAPVPMKAGELDEWNECLSSKSKNPLRIVTPGPLLEFAKPEDYDGDEKATARRAFRRRLLATPGVIASLNDDVTCSLYISATTYTPNGATEENFRRLREEWCTPDGWALSEAVAIWRHARELALGFHYVWDPRPPLEWLDARRQWAQFVRLVISHSKSLDTELVVRNAVKSGALNATNKEGVPGIELWNRWAELAPTFTISPKAIWHDDGALKLCQKWAKDGPGIIWTEHSFFGHALAQYAGLQYYGEEGRNASGGFIDDADPKSTIVASAKANSVGRNLQAWNRNLITSSPAGAPAWEQLLGRTHRHGQTADQVIADVLVACREHFDSFNKACELARSGEQLIGHSKHKLLIADIDFPTEIDVRNAARTIVRWKGMEG